MSAHSDVSLPGKQVTPIQQNRVFQKRAVVVHHIDLGQNRLLRNGLFLQPDKYISHDIRNVYVLLR